MHLGYLARVADPSPPVWPDQLRPGPHNAVTDVAGVRVGHHQRTDDGWLTGTTVVLAPAGTTGGLDIRGGGPAVTDTALLDPSAMVQHVDAVCFSGGSAFGLAAADGVRTWLAEQHTGFRVGPEPHHVVPIVPGAALFDLGLGGAYGNRPDAAFGYAAAAAAADGPVPMGTVGAGTGAHAGHLKGGIGTASVVLPSGITVAALVALNSAGSPVDPHTGALWGLARALPGEFTVSEPNPAALAEFRAHVPTPRDLNTTLAVVVTDAALSKAECTRLAGAAHDGMARAIDPIHQYTDGDVAFALATGAHVVADGDEQMAGARFAALGALGAAAADAVARAIVHATLAATPAGGLPTYRDAFHP